MRTNTVPGRHDDIQGIENLDKIIIIDQSPIGRTPRSNAATYTGVFTPIRELFAATPEAKLRGYSPDDLALMFEVEDVSIVQVMESLRLK